MLLLPVILKTGHEWDESYPSSFSMGILFVQDLARCIVYPIPSAMKIDTMKSGESSP
jgi:hypothetical protein